MNRKHRKMVRIVAIVLAVLLGLSAVISALLSIAYGEEALETNVNSCELIMEYLEEEQALRMSQRLVYTNASEFMLDRVLFYVPANLFRRQSTLPYSDEELAQVLPAGYLPGGIELTKVLVNGEDCDWGYQGMDEACLRIACNLAENESCTFEFEYYLLLTENNGFLGVAKNGWNLSNFYFSPASLDENGEFILNPALSFTRYMDVPAMDFSASIALPADFHLASSGIEQCVEAQNNTKIWSMHANSMRDFAITFGSAYREYIAESASGVQIRLLSDSKHNASDILSITVEAIDDCEAWLGNFPHKQIDILQTDYALEFLNHTACLWLSRNTIKEGGRAVEHALRRFIAQQYFGCSVWTAPVSDAWLADSISEFLAYLILEETSGHQAYLQAINDELVDSLQLTIPGGLCITSSASLFTTYEYEIVVRNRGAVVFHELYTAMGREDLITGLRLFYQWGLSKDILTEMDLVHALDEASGKSWEKFLTDWVFNIGEYVNQEIFWLD